MIKTVSELAVNDWFVDPLRAGRRPAQVLAIHGIRRNDYTGLDMLHFTLNDATQWGPWVASYPVGENLLVLDEENSVNPRITDICDLITNAGSKWREDAARHIGAQDLTPRERDAILARFWPAPVTLTELAESHYHDDDQICPACTL